jgi:pSer/pThr/pTyr-binding forkhead associated (FHA) protein
MARVTLQVIDGADRGKVFLNIPTPVTVGREEGNVVQLNDERVSRFHLKIQEDEGQIVLTDLESTNGTRVNGEFVKICTLRPGDVISIGRTVLLFGSREEIAQRLAMLRGADLSAGVYPDEEVEATLPRWSLDEELAWSDQPDAQAVLHILLPPELPKGLSPGQIAQLWEVFQYLHLRLRRLIQSVQPAGKKEKETVILDQRQWQNLLDLQGRLAAYLRTLEEPEPEI